MTFPSLSLIFEDWPRKLAALALALIIWWSVYRQIQETITIREIPVQLQPPADMIIINPNQIPRINVTVRGPKRTLNYLTANKIRITHRIPSDTQPGPYQIRLLSRDFDIEGRVQIQDIENHEFTVLLDRMVSKQLEVSPTFLGDGPEGWRQNTVTVTPARVTVTGPASAIEDLERIKKVPTQPIELSRDTSISFVANPPMATYPNVEIFPDHVEVYVEYARVFDQQLFPNLPILILQDEDLRDELRATLVNPPAAGVKAVIRGPADAMQDLNQTGAAGIRAFVDVSDKFKPGIYKVPVQIWIENSECSIYLPPEPSRIEVRITAVEPPETPAETPAEPPAAPAPAPEPPAETEPADAP